MTKTTQQYQIEVIETLSTVVKVQAKNEEQAFAKIKEDYRQQKIVLEAVFTS